MPPRAARAIGASYGDLWGREDALEEQALEMANGAAGGSAATRPGTVPPNSIARSAGLGVDPKMLLVWWALPAVGGVVLGRKYGFKGAAAAAVVAGLAHFLLPEPRSMAGALKKLTVGRRSEVFMNPLNAFVQPLPGSLPYGPTTAGALLAGVLFGAGSKRIR